MGGMGIGASFVGGIPKMSVDFNKLACSHLHANGHGPKVLKMDLMPADSTKIIHQKFGESPGTITFGVPCQPLPQQGLQRGSRDFRFRTFWKGLQIIFSCCNPSLPYWNVLLLLVTTWRFTTASRRLHRPWTGWCSL